MATRPKKGSGQKGVQLQLAFSDPPQKDRKLPADCEFPPLAEMFTPMTDEELARDFDQKFPL